MHNHRGITISLTLGKVFESIIFNKGGSLRQSLLQFGFTNGLSPLMAAVCLTEALCEARALGKDLYVATLDTQKAFDVVSHPILMDDLMNTDIPDDLWLAIYDLYDGITEAVFWDGQLSRPFNVQQGVGQGRILSPTLYKIYMNSVLQAFQQSGVGFQPAADSIALCSGSLPLS